MRFTEFFAQYFTEFCEAPEIFARWAGVNLLSIAINKSIHLLTGEQEIYPNIWSVIIAPSSRFHKSTVLASVKKFTRLLDPILIYPSQFSLERFLEIVEVQDAGILIFSEFADFLGTLSKDYMEGATAVLTDFYDVPEIYKRETRKTSITVNKPFLSILAASTPDWLRGLKEEDFKGGFFARFIFLVARESDLKKSIPLPPPADRQKMKIISDFLALVHSLRFIQAILPDDTKETYIHWYNNQQALRLKLSPSLFQGMASRLAQYCLKLAIIFTIDEYFSQPNLLANIKPTVSANAIIYAKLPIPLIAMQRAIKWSEELWSRALDFYNQITLSKSEINRRKLLQILADHLQGMSRAELLRESRMSISTFNETIKTLLESELIEEYRAKGPKGNPVKHYRIIF